jgi:hypothetical protein
LRNLPFGLYASTAYLTERRTPELAGIEEIEMWLVGRSEVRSTAYLKATFATTAHRLNAFAAEVIDEQPTPARQPAFA